MFTVSVGKQSEEEGSKTANDQLFDTKNLQTTKDLQIARHIFAKIMTTRKQRVLNFTFASNKFIIFSV